jgi:hypothetical protein
VRVVYLRHGVPAPDEILQAGGGRGRPSGGGDGRRKAARSRGVRPVPEHLIEGCGDVGRRGRLTVEGVTGAAGCHLGR